MICTAKSVYPAYKTFFDITMLGVTTNAATIA